MGNFFFFFFGICSVVLWFIFISYRILIKNTQLVTYYWNFPLFFSPFLSLSVSFLEYMSGGRIYDFLHKQKGVFTLPTLIRVAIDVSKGMN